MKSDVSTLKVLGIIAIIAGILVIVFPAIIAYVIGLVLIIYGILTLL
jgi:uncharacterized membrane protein HdeD (DUF308 family)